MCRQRPFPRVSGADRVKGPEPPWHTRFKRSMSVWIKHTYKSRCSPRQRPRAFLLPRIKFGWPRPAAVNEVPRCGKRLGQGDSEEATSTAKPACHFQHKRPLMLTGLVGRKS
ncbi:hypothetical protein IF1G_08700 [Cordyceps javanica]|uniref:Uncharacterized protein n=1 Tax=Cordyceps javanica TaxID=43265 RepID=A0A545UTJ4_9HYPO|nr:hypothetical protein IF1G_08700 [Cordyceps javanica]